MSAPPDHAAGADHGGDGAQQAAQHGQGGVLGALAWPLSWLLGGEEAPDEEALARDFAAGMVRTYGAGAPAFLECSARDAIARARDQFSLLLVYVHSQAHQDTPAFVGDVLCAEPVAGFIREHFLVWGADVTAPDGYECQEMFKVGGFPYLGVYLHVGAGKVQCLWSREGYLPPEPLLEGLQSAVTEGAPVVAQARAAHEARVEDRLLREQQEAQYNATLVADMQRQAAAEAAEQESSLMDALKLSRSMAKEEELKLALARVQAAPEPPPPAAGGRGVDGAPVATVRLQFPDGTKVQRRFAGSAPVRLVRDFALVFMAQAAGATPDEVELTCAFPRKTYREADWAVPLTEAGWHPRVALFVTGVEHTDEGEMAAEAQAAVAADGAASSDADLLG